MPPATPYTRDQADRALHLIRTIAEDCRAAYVRARAGLRDFRGAGPMPDLESEEGLPEGARATLLELRSFVLELQELGVVLHDPELGVVSFRGLHGGAVVNYCWKLGEAHRVRFWFPLDGSYAERRPLDIPAPV